MSGRAAEGIAAYFGRDHDEIGALLSSVDARDPVAGPARLKEFRARLERHIVWEEEVLFAAVTTRAAALEREPIEAMRAEHAAIRAGIREALEESARGEGERAQRRVEEVSALLARHNAREERQLYPALDRALSADELGRLIGLFEASSGSDL